MDKEFATDCKPVEYVLVAIASCVVSGVGYAAGQTIRTAKERVVKHLVETSTARLLGEVVELTPEEQAKAIEATEQESAAAPSPKARITRSKKRKQG